MIIAQTNIFASNLQKKAATGEEFELATLAKNLTVDIIANVVLDQEFHVQTSPPGTGVTGPRGLLTAFEGVQRHFIDRSNIGPGLLNPIRYVKLWYYKR